MNKLKRLVYRIFLLFALTFFTIFQAQSQASLSENIKLQKDTLEARRLLDNEKSLIANGFYQNAIDVLEEAQSLYSFHGLWEEAVQCVNRLARLSDNFDSADLKVKYADHAINLARQHLPKDHLQVAFAFRQKAEALMWIGVLDSANYFLNQAVPIFNKHEIWEETGWCEILLGVNYLNQQQIDSCQNHFDKVQKLILEKELPEKDKEEIQADLLNLQGVLYQMQGDLDKAIDNTRQALAIDVNKSELSAIDSAAIANRYHNLGAFYHAKGDYQRALDNFMQAIYSYKNASIDPSLLHNIGGIFSWQQKHQEAINYFQQSFQLADQRPDLIKVQMNALNGLGVAYRDLGVPDSAVFYCQKAINLPTDYRKFYAWATMGNLFIGKKQAGQALENLRMAESAYHKDATTTGHSPFFMARIYQLRGDAHLLNQDLDTALKFYQKALIVNHTDFKDSLNYESNPSSVGVFEPTFFLKTLRGKAKALAAINNQQAAALATFQLAIQWIDTLQQGYSSEASQLDWSGEFKQIFAEAIEVAFQLYQEKKESKYLDLAFSFSEKSKNAILLEALKATEGKSYAGVPDSLIQKEKDLKLDIAFYEKTLQKAKDQNVPDKEKLYQQYLSKTRLKLAVFKEKLEQDFPKFHALKYGGKRTSIAIVQNKLIDNESAFLEYFLGDSSAYVFVITKDSADLLQLDAPTALKNSVAEFREVLLDFTAFQQNVKTAFAAYEQKAAALYLDIVQPVLAILPTNIQHLSIVPDGVLNTIPFEALIKEEEIQADFDFAKLPYLLYDFQMQYAYSADLLLKNRERQAQLLASTECLAFAPTYQGTKQIAQRGNLNQLRDAGSLEGTAHEIQQISRYFKGQFEIGESATEKQFKSKADQFGILHLAMHGMADFENANFNHLIFSNSTGDSKEDNLLHHYEIANMELNAQLVVLSACETGVGKYEKGEGVYSLARSFMYAGVPSVMMSLWKVSDEGTSKLMPYFYESLADGNSKSAALQEAKVRFLQEANLEFRHPFFWSAFVMLGDAGKMNTEHSNLIWWGIGLLLLGILFFWYWKRKPL